MANGGIIGPPNTPSPFSQCAAITTKTATGPFTTQPKTAAVDYLVVAGGGGAGWHGACAEEPLGGLGG